MYFHHFVIISPWKRAGSFIWTNLNPHHPRMPRAKFGWNWPSGSGEEDENVKSLQTDRQTDRRTERRKDGRTDGQTDDGRQVIRKAHLSFQLRWAKKLNTMYELELEAFRLSLVKEAFRLSRVKKVFRLSWVKEAFRLSWEKEAFRLFWVNEAFRLFWVNEFWENGCLALWD